jgi:hypothetical protein
MYRKRLNSQETETRRGMRHCFGERITPLPSRYYW